ncbi:Pfs, NACHT and ankyrin domain protein [Hortaea werneckii]|nr:Pfs, NACHT and ankyrin domain protein [Hortaea werneckii]KAI6871953.1 Pfs, NACHT and ankyrin domain protein [Hortaea werneckii]
MAKGLRSLWKDSDVRKIDAEIDFFLARLNFYCSWSSSKLDPRNQDLLVTIQQRLASPDPFANLHKALKLRSANTGKWYLQGAQFEAYKAQSFYFGWLYGSAGSGKTILSAGIIDSLQHFCSKDPARSLAFFFFDFNDVAKQGANNMAKSLLSQFLQKCTGIPDAAQRLSTTASEQQLLNALRDIMETLPMPFVVLDALDECNDRERLFEILKEIHSWGNESLHMLVTSRKEVGIEDTLEDLVLFANRTCLESHLVDEDIRTYVHDRLTEDKSFRRWQRDPEMQEEIEQTLGKQACGMFRWAACQLDTLAHCLTRGKVRRALQDLPRTLYDTYDRMILKIDESPNGEEALKILRVLTYAQRPLSAEELLEVTGIVLTDDDAIFDKDEVLQDLRDILRICLSLVSIIPAVQDRDKSNTDTSVEPTGKYIRLAHFSVKEYLVSTRPCLEKYSLLEKDSHDILATSCLVYLHQFQGEEWKDYNCEAKFPFARYAAVYWTHHARVSDFQTKRQRDLCMELLTERLPAYRSWHRFYDMYLNDVETDDISREITEFPSPLFSASSEGLVHVVHAILEDENVNIDATWNERRSALCQASKMGYRRIVELLLAKGADPNVQRDRYDHSLVRATRYGDKKIVEMLLDAGADVHAEEFYYGTAFDAASEIGDKELMEMLLAKDANLEARGECYGQALIQASITGREDLVEVLLAHGADVKVRRPPALDASTLKLLLDCAESFLARGAVPNGSPGTFGTALAAASFVGLSERIVEMLLANGADVDARGVGSLTPLQLASYRGNTKIVQMLLAQGANVNALPGCWYGSAMMAASIGGHQAIIQMLQAKGARLQKGEWEAILKWKHDRDNQSMLSIVAQPDPPIPTSFCDFQ